MSFKEFVLKMLTSHSGISSKRVCGFLGWIVALGLAIYATIQNINTPDIVDIIIYASSGLLGVDSITGIWKNKNSIKNE